MRACVRVNARENENGWGDGDGGGGGDKSSIPMYPALWDWGTKLKTTEGKGEHQGQEQDSVSDSFDIALGADLVRLPPPLSLCHE